MDATSWSGYVTGFHSERAGITERVLGRARTTVGDPYDWLLAATPGEGTILDLACGSAPLWSRLSRRSYLGVDTAAAELAVAADRGATVVRTSATELPVRSRSADIVTCSMGLQVIQPLADALAEVGRVLAPGGRVVATLPADGPVRAGDLPAVGVLLALLGRRLTYPNDAELRRLPELCASAGLRLSDDERRRFAYPLDDVASADVFLASLYLPGVTSGRYAAARRWLRGLARVHAVLPVPIRRVVVVRA